MFWEIKLWPFRQKGGILKGNGKDFKCNCGKLTVKGSLNPLVDLEGCPIHRCGRPILRERRASENFKQSPEQVIRNLIGG